MNFRINPPEAQQLIYVIHKLAVFQTTLFIQYLPLSFRSQILKAARTTAARALGQMGISIPAAIILILKIKRHNWAQARKRSKIPITNEAGRFIILPPEK